MTSISSYGTGAAKAVHALLQLTRMDCGGSGAAAAVLLSAYNGHDYNLDITELCRLDQHYYQAAMRVIDLRCRLRIEPHLLIQNGDEVFQKLAADWPQLHVNYSSKPGIEGEQEELSEGASDE